VKKLSSRLRSWVKARVHRERPEPPRDKRDEVYQAAERVAGLLERTAHPQQLLGEDEFERAVALLLDDEHWAEELMRYGRGNNVPLACIALEALARRRQERGIVRGLLAALNDYSEYRRFFLLRALDGQARGSILARVLVRLDFDWTEYPSIDALRDFVVRRLGEGDSISIDALWRRLDDARRETLGALLKELDDVLPAEATEEFKRSRESSLNFEFLTGVGRVWDDSVVGQADRLVLATSVLEHLAEAEAALTSEPPRSVVVVGEAGVGKTSLVHELGRRLLQQGWRIFEAAPAAVLADQIYIGQLEARVQDLIRELGGKPALWYMPEFMAAAWAGRHQNNPRSLLDLLLPHVESGRIRLIGEVEPAEFERLAQLSPRSRGAFQAVRLVPFSDDETLEAGRRWQRATGVQLSDATLDEALQLAKHYLPQREAPGILVSLLDETGARLPRGGSRRTIEIDDLLSTVSALTGLPAGILDERADLDLAELRAFFARRVLGQPEAVQCLVERVAMVKAGLSDPSRPLGVFLFVGPTGTGKTEIAKTLAEYLFGSPGRMTRLDMSEFQTAESLSRILGNVAEPGQGTALVDDIRRQPFSVVLLDEFEKAHPNIWDLFLQVFDDGRLTDRRGATADFRHCVVIMTSNLGAERHSPLGFRFQHEDPQFSPGAIERAVAATFRPEFVNRIDRIVVFHPFNRDTLREIIKKELREVLTRRGFRVRTWAVEWDESAIDFLLEKGFTADLGARPLRRAIERYLLSPLAMTIVDHQVPEGDQFLFVRASADRLDVEFIDPDAENGEPPDGAAQLDLSLSLQSLALDGRGSRTEVAFLERTFEGLRARIEGVEWQDEKRAALAAMSAPGFWDTPERFGLLGTAEYMDRIEAGLRTAGSLLRRLTSSSNGRRRLPAEIVERLAEQLYLVQAASNGLDAGLPRDAFLQVEAVEGEGKGNGFAARIGGMYKQWAEKRRMHMEVLLETPERYRLIAAVSGFGAYAILRPETGLHVLERPSTDGRPLSRMRVHVRVAGQPDAERRDLVSLREAAERALAEPDADDHRIVRRYRELPSPLVRDAIRGWRSGRVDLVLGGDFDLVGVLGTPVSRSGDK
jgi:ATP-dependent Clp protease ATP-binding subunit ClpC